MSHATAFFIDFDGVICDSLTETMQASWLAYHKYLLGSVPETQDPGLKSRFLALRPFIRSGEDYIVIQDLIFRDLAVEDQAAFDALIDLRGPDTMKHYKEIFYKARIEILETDKAKWLSYNPLFPCMERAFKALKPDAAVYILSTKKPEFILEILTGNGIDFVPEKVIYSASESKLGIIREYMAKHGHKRAVFIDDQISHLLNNTDPRIEVYLASWGYVQPEWLIQGVPVISAEEAEKLMAGG